MEQINDEPLKGEFLLLLKEIGDSIGTVPILNDNVPLPNREFLPPQFETSKMEWQNTIFKLPSRKSSEGESLRFFIISTMAGDKKVEVASVRYHLISLDANANDESEAISYTDADIYAIGDLQADHLQASEQIVARQQEMLMAMNVDPLFAAQMKSHPEANAYFKEENGIVYGTKYFYLVYHNCIDNLWLISAAANTGAGKGNKDSIAWLKAHPRFGDAFFFSLGGEPSIDKTAILYITNQSKMLAQAAREWFLLTYGSEITAAKYVRRHISHPIKASLEELAREEPSRKNRNKAIHIMATMVLAELLLERRQSTTSSDSDKPSSSGTSTPESAGMVTEENLILMDSLATSRGIVSHFRGKEDELAELFKHEHKKIKKGDQS